MSGMPRDEPFLQWALHHHYRYYYTSERGLPEPCLKIHLGVVTAYLHHGKLIHLAIESEGGLLDEMMCELSLLFAQCARHNAYVEQAACRV